jgi:hypothetical protein
MFAGPTRKLRTTTPRGRDRNVGPERHAPPHPPERRDKNKEDKMKGPVLHQSFMIVLASLLLSSGLCLPKSLRY